MDIEQFRRAGHDAIDHVCDYFQGIQNGSPDVVSDVQPGYLAPRLPSHAPQRGEPPEAIVQDFHKHVMPGITHWQHPHFYAYFPSNTSFESILGDLYSAAVGSPGFNWLCSPAVTELEAVVCDWVARMLGLDECFLTTSQRGGGIIQTTASEACLVVVVSARERALLWHEKELHPEAKAVGRTVRDAWSPKLVMYGSTQTHSLGAKAALVFGVIWKPLEVGSDLVLTGDILAKAIEEDLQAGLLPFFVIGTVGTTSSGVIDRIDEIGAVCERYPTVSLYVDAAWGGVALSCPEFREQCQLDAINKYADTFSTNFHKMGLTGFDCTLLFTRDRSFLTDALDVTPAYLRNKHNEAGGAVLDYRNMQLGLGRKFRSLKLWFVLRGFGVEGFQAHVRHAVELAQLAESLVKQNKDFALVQPRSLMLVVFRLEPERVKRGKWDDVNRKFHAQLTERTDVMFTQTVLPPNLFCIRWALGAPATQATHIEAAWAILQQEAESAVAGFI